jgi:hypothetical protein
VEPTHIGGIPNLNIAGDEQIITFANVYRLPRHLQEWAKHKKYSWTERGLKKARVWADQHPSSPYSL